ncbi:MAG: AtpZ/AtpI family protein [Thermoanaerobaculia bacterium]
MDGNKRQEYKQLLEASAIGWMFPLAIGIGFGIGYGLDKLFGSWPWLTAIFSIFGIVAAFLNLFRMSGADEA